jgi:hypothetical protein
MRKTIKQVFGEYLDEQKKKLAPRTYEYYDETVYYLEQCLNGYGYNTLGKEDAKKFDENFKKGIEFCDTFEPQILSSSNFFEFLGYYYPKKIACGHDRAKKICGATTALYKWMVKNKYILQEEDGDEIELKESVDYLRESFDEGMEKYG